MATIAELLLARGRSEADAIRQRGDSSAQMWTNLGGLAANALTSYAQQKEQEPIRKQAERITALKVEEAEAEAKARKAAQEADGRFSTYLQDWDGKPETLHKAATLSYGPEVGTKKAKEIWDGFKALHSDPRKDFADTQSFLKPILQGMNALPEDVRARVYPDVRKSLVERGAITEQDAPPEYQPEWWQSTVSYGQEPLKPVAVEGVGPNGEAQTRFVVPEAGTTVDKPAPKVTYAAPQFYMVGGKKTLVRPASDGSLRDLKGAVIDGASIQPMPTAEGAPERPSVWVAKDGNMRYVTPSDAAKLSAEGWKPGNTREQGRPVTSGDAGRIADFKTSLSDLGVLKSTLTETKGATGTSAQIGAAMPAWATDLLGWGVDAKKRQGVIDRVKQVIGKTLEGGVLRKEDEYKYEKILPTIKDTAEVAESKLRGLEQAISQRQQTFIDSLADAGYDVTDFNARQSATQPKSADPLGIR